MTMLTSHIEQQIEYFRAIGDDLSVKAFATELLLREELELDVLDEETE